MMTQIGHELQSVRKYCESHDDFRIVACIPAMIRVNIQKTEHKQLTVCIQFPVKYPENSLLIELKSKTLKEHFLNGLTKLSEKECRKYLGKPQVIKILTFLKEFLEENPLCVCSEELLLLKRELGQCDAMKLKQRTSSLSLHLTERLYFLKVKVVIPNIYPEKQIQIEITECNFPLSFKNWFSGQAREIARQCVQKPLKQKPKDPHFQAKPSLWPTLKFLVQEVNRYPSEVCPLCCEKCFPRNPNQITNDESEDLYIERVYCGHIFHKSCLDSYMKTPPFDGGKKCPQCDQVIYHEKWKLSTKLYEDRWAHHEAKQRELGEVVEFFE